VCCELVCVCVSCCSGFGQRSHVGKEIESSEWQGWWRRCTSRPAHLLHATPVYVSVAVVIFFAARRLRFLTTALRHSIVTVSERRKMPRDETNFATQSSLQKIVCDNAPVPLWRSARRIWPAHLLNNTLRHLSLCNGWCVWFFCCLQRTCYLLTYLLTYFPFSLLGGQQTCADIYRHVSLLFVFIRGLGGFTCLRSLLLTSMLLVLFLHLISVSVCARVCVRVKNGRVSDRRWCLVTSHFSRQIAVIFIHSCVSLFSFALSALFCFCARRCLRRSVLSPTRLQRVASESF